MRYPDGLGPDPIRYEYTISAIDIMPTLLSMCDVEIPATCQGRSLKESFYDNSQPQDSVALIACYVPFHEWNRERGGKEYRGLRSNRYTYVKDLNGEWLFYDNYQDPYQMRNEIDNPAYKELINQFDILLHRKLESVGDNFLPGDKYMQQWNYTYD